MSSASSQPFEQSEQFAIEQLVKLFHESPNTELFAHSFGQIIGIEDENLGQKLFYRLQSLGVIEQRESHISGAMRKALFHDDSDRPKYRSVISPRIIDIIAQRSAPVDRVAAAESWIRRHRVLSSVFIALVVLTFLATLINQTTQFIDWVIETEVFK